MPVLDDDPVYDPEDLDRKVQDVQSELARRREELEELERHRQELEALNAKEHNFHEGRNEMEDKLSRSVTKMERLIREAQSRAEAMEYAVETFRQHLSIIRRLRPEEWDKDEMHEELNRALALIAGAESDYIREMRRLEGFEEEAEKATKSARRSVSGNPQGFLHWMTLGVAFTLPLIVAIAVAVVFILTAMAKP
jgi:hypothetical protein